LGEAAAHIEAEKRDNASGSLDEIAALLAEPGYDHPLETAHAALLCVLAGKRDSAVESVAQLYARLGIDWSVSYLTSFLEAGKLAGPIPI
jgi:hypothetical protein